MNQGTSLAARLLVLMFFVAVGAGIYAYTVKSNLAAAEHQMGVISKDRDTWKLRLEQYQAQGKEDAATLAQCQTQVTDLTTELEAAKAAAATPARRR